jgi:hypothetical protein
VRTSQSRVTGLRYVGPTSSQGPTIFDSQTAFRNGRLPPCRGDFDRVSRWRNSEDRAIGQRLPGIRDGKTSYIIWVFAPISRFVHPINMGINNIDDAITIETDLFAHRQVKTHFINPCCFGEDFAQWLKDELAPLAHEGFTFSDSIQEDYGWGFWVWHGKIASGWPSLMPARSPKNPLHNGSFPSVTMPR